MVAQNLETTFGELLLSIIERVVFVSYGINCGLRYVAVEHTYKFFQPQLIP